MTFEDGRVSRNVETFLPYKHLSLPETRIDVSVAEEEEAYSIYLKSRGFAAFVELDFDDADVIFSDNYFHLTDLQGYTVRVDKQDIMWGSFAGCEDFRKRLKIRTLINTYIDKI